MRLRIKFSSEEKEFRLPIHYNEIIQGFIYRHLSPSLAEKIHNQGFVDPETGKKFKFFTFSRLIPETKPIIQKNSIIFKSPVNLIITSVNTNFIQSLVENLLTNPEVKLFNQKVILSSVEVLPLPIDKNFFRIRTLSPVTVYTTFNTRDGKKKTHYYAPYEDAFKEGLIQNLMAKVRALTGKNPVNKIKITPLGKLKEKVVIYKNFVIKGWDGEFEIKGEPEILKIALLSGLGAKNSAGFGCVEILR